MKKLTFVLLACFLLVLIGCTKTVTVTFNTDGGVEVAAKEITKGEKVSLPTISKEGYEVDGWFFDSEFTKPYQDQAIEEDTTLYVKWKVLTFEVKFQTDAGVQIGTPQTVEYGKAATAPTPPAKPGHTFVRWDKAFDSVKEDLVVKAVYSANSYTVKFFDHDGSQIGETQQVVYEKAATAPTAPTRDGYTFDGWDKAFDKITDNLEIHAVYKINTYTVVFKDHEGNIIAEKTVEYGKATIAPTAPTREGFVFKNWDKSFSNVTENLTVTAVYEVKTFTVEFRDFDNKRIGSVQTIEYGKAAEAPATPTKTGYTFIKWNVDFSNVKSNLIVIPEYSLTKYYVKYYDGETLLDVQTEFTAAVAPVLTTYSKDGYLFVGWYSDAELGEDTLVESIVKGTAQDITLYGKWLDMSKKHTITYELDGGSWTWNDQAITDPTNGIDPYSDLPEIFMQDFYTYLKDNNLLSSSVVAAKLRKTNWVDFSKDYDDPYAIYNHTTSNTSQTTDGYSQYFYTTATGDTSTGLILTIEGGFFGTEPYKSKYWNLAQHMAYLTNLAYSTNYFWSGASSKSLVGFVIDGYFYGTQGARSGLFFELRKTIPTPTKGFKVQGTTLVEVERSYAVNEYIMGLTATLYSPSKVGFAFDGWYDNATFTGEKISVIPAGVNPAEKYYAKWKALE